MYIGHGTAFGGLGSWSFGNDSAMNVIIFGVDNSSTYTNNCKNNFLVLPEEPTDNIDGSTETAEKKLSINFSKASKQICLGLHYNGDNSYLRKNIFACLFSVYNRISLSRHEQVHLMRLSFERYFSHHRAT